MWLHLARLLENISRFASDHRTLQRRLASLGNSGQGSSFCVRDKWFGKLLFASSYKTKKQLDLQSLSYEGFGIGVLACCMRQTLFMRRSNITASTVLRNTNVVT